MSKICLQTVHVSVCCSSLNKSGMDFCIFEFQISYMNQSQYFEDTRQSLPAFKDGNGPFTTARKTLTWKNKQKRSRVKLQKKNNQPPQPIGAITMRHEMPAGGCPWVSRDLPSLLHAGHCSSSSVAEHTHTFEMEKSGSLGMTPPLRHTHLLPSTRSTLLTHTTK